MAKQCVFKKINQEIEKSKQLQEETRMFEYEQGFRLALEYSKICLKNLNISIYKTNIQTVNEKYSFGQGYKDGLKLTFKLIEENF